MIPKSTENTVTRLLANELEKFGVEVVTFASVKTPAGRREVDLLCRNAGWYPCEAKFTDRDLIDAVVKVQNDYIKYHEVLGVKGGFAILYPEKLSRPMPVNLVRELAHKEKFKVVMMFLPEDKRNFSVLEGTLINIARELSKQILTPPEYVEPSIDYMIKILRESAIYIATGLRHLRGKQLEDLFGGKQVFENILQYEEKKYPEESLRLASGYILVNQLLFYHVLSKKMPHKFSEINPDLIKSPVDLNTYFRRVLDVNYRAVLSYDVASRIPPRFTNEVKKIVSVVQGVSPEKVGGDLLGTIFHDLVPFDVRKSVAAFYTNVLAAELLAWLSIDKEDVKVADLACGSGGLLVAAYRKKKFILEQMRRFTQEDHKRFVGEDLLGVDVMPFAANVAACHLALQSPEYFTNKVQVAVWDSTELEPGRKIPSIAGLKFAVKGQLSLDAFEPFEKTKGAVSLTGERPEEVNLEKYDVVIMNPPFTRQQRIPTYYKNLLFDRFSEYKEYLHGKLGYYGYFILLADRFLKEGGKMALVLPATVLKAKSAEGVRIIWSQKYHLEYVITTWYRSAFSESVLLREILLVARKRKPLEDAKTTVIMLEKLPRNFKEAQDIAMRIKEGQKIKGMVTKAFNYSELRDCTRDWFKQIAVSSPYLIELMKSLKSIGSKKLSILRHLNIEVEPRDAPELGGSFGILCLNSSSKAIRGDAWIIEHVETDNVRVKHRRLNTLMEIPKTALKEAFRRSAYRGNMDVSKLNEYVIVKEFAELNQPLSLMGVEVGWDKWLEYVERRTTNLSIVTRCEITAPGTCLLSYYSEIPRCWSRAATSAIRGLKSEDAKILCVWFNSTINLLQFLIERKETRGAWMELSKFILMNLYALDPSKLSNNEKAVLSRLFKDLSNIEFPSVWKQLAMNVKEDAFSDEERNLLSEVFKEFNEHLGKGFEPRKRIDRTILFILGFPSDKHEKILTHLYTDLLKEFARLKKIIIAG